MATEISSWWTWIQIKSSINRTIQQNRLHAAWKKKDGFYFHIRRWCGGYPCWWEQTFDFYFQYCHDQVPCKGSSGWLALWEFPFSIILFQFSEVLFVGLSWFFFVFLVIFFTVCSAVLAKFWCEWGLAYRSQDDPLLLVCVMTVQQSVVGSNVWP